MMTRKNVPTNSARTALQKLSDCRSRAVRGRKPAQAAVSRRPTSRRQQENAVRTAATIRPAAVRQRPSSRASPVSSRARFTSSRSRAVREVSHPVQLRPAAATRRPTDAMADRRLPTPPLKHSTSDSSSRPTEVISASEQSHYYRSTFCFCFTSSLFRSRILYYAEVPLFRPTNSIKALKVFQIRL